MHNSKKSAGNRISFVNAVNLKIGKIMNYIFLSATGIYFLSNIARISSAKSNLYRKLWKQKYTWVLGMSKTTTGVHCRSLEPLTPKFEKAWENYVFGIVLKWLLARNWSQLISLAGLFNAFFYFTAIFPAARQSVMERPLTTLIVFE